MTEQSNTQASDANAGKVFDPTKPFRTRGGLEIADFEVAEFGYRGNVKYEEGSRRHIYWDDKGFWKNEAYPDDLDLVNIEAPPAPTASEGGEDDGADIDELMKIGSSFPDFTTTGEWALTKDMRAFITGTLALFPAIKAALVGKDARIAELERHDYRTVTLGGMTLLDQINRARSQRDELADELTRLRSELASRETIREQALEEAALLVNDMDAWCRPLDIRKAIRALASTPARSMDAPADAAPDGEGDALEQDDQGTQRLAGFTRWVLNNRIASQRKEIARLNKVVDRLAKSLDGARAGLAKPADPPSASEAMPGQRVSDETVIRIRTCMDHTPNDVDDLCADLLEARSGLRARPNGMARAIEIVEGLRAKYENFGPNGPTREWHNLEHKVLDAVEAAFRTEGGAR